MLRAITISGNRIILSIDAGEIDTASLEDGLLTEDELEQVRAIAPGALPGYQAVPRDLPVAGE